MIHDDKIDELFNDDDIEVLGDDFRNLESRSLPRADVPVAAQRRNRRKRWPIIVLIAIAVASIFYALAAHYELREMSLQRGRPDLFESQMSAQNSPDASTHVAAVSSTRIPAFVDSINNTPFRLYPVDRLIASVSLEWPELTDHDVALATPAADYRADNGQIVGDFILDKKELARGTRKEGWCYVSPAGVLTIGIGDADDVKELAMERGGCFFRQYALVMDGTIVPNILRGKSLRRALGFLEGKPYMVRSLERESIYDFSQALADYGFSHAIYLPGGDGKWIANTESEEEFSSLSDPADVCANYLIFKSK